MNWDEACKEVMRACERGEGGDLLRFAHTYAKAGLTCSVEERPDQALYIRCNLQEWRGQTAKEVKNYFRSYKQGDE